MTQPEITVTAPVGPDGAPLLVLGPSLGTSTMLWETTTPLLTASYRVIAWDLPGHGSAPAASDSFSVCELADAVADAVQVFETRAVLYAGVSLAGAVGLELMLRHPDLVAAAAVVASGAQLGNPAAWHERAAKVEAETTSALVPQSEKRWFAPGAISRIPELSDRLLQTLRNVDDGSYARCCEALAAFDVRSRLGEILVPTLAVWGEHDRVAPEGKAAEIVAGVADGRMLRIADAAHLPPAEQPDIVAEGLLNFFADVV